MHGFLLQCLPSAFACVTAHKSIWSLSERCCGLSEQAVHGLSTSLQEWQGFLHYCQALASVSKVSEAAHSL